MNQEQREEPPEQEQPEGAAGEEQPGNERSEDKRSEDERPGPGPGAAEAEGAGTRDDTPPPGQPGTDRPNPAPHNNAPHNNAPHNNVNQYFLGALDARQAHFGIGGHGGADTPNARRTAVGRLDAGEADAILESYVEPRRFDEAVAALDRDSVVVLVGPSGVGKRSGAVALLNAVADGTEYVVLSPGRSLDELATGRPAFEKGVGYVLLDRMNEGSSGTADFDWRRVRDAVREQGAHLVVTTVHTIAGKSPESVRHVPWRAPDLADVLRLRLRKAGCAETVVEEAVDLLPAECLIAEVTAAAARIARGADPAGVWKEYGSSAAQPVRDWFAVDRSLQETAEVTVLAFTIGTGYREFESWQERLEPRIAPAFPKPVQPDEVQSAALQPAVDRRRSLARNRLAATEEQKHGALTRTVLVFPNPQYRQWVLEELWTNHSKSYWDGVQDWLTEIILTDPGTGPHLSVASGLALLARPAFDEVAESYLEPWARGEAGPAGQSMATLVLCWMCLDENLDATALALARSWVLSRDPGLRSTAAAAFGGELGVRFPTDAVKLLWHLISRRSGQSKEAMFALADLVAVLAECREDAGVVFRALAHRLGVQRRTNVATQLRENTFDAVLAVLTVGDLRTGQPVGATLMERQPQLIGRLGELWAGLLCNRPRRTLALRALYDTLRTLSAVGEEPRTTAGQFGRSVGAALPPDERRLLAAALRPAAVRSGSTTAALIDTFLTTVLSTED
ncbi:hypothetical protein [Streptomyces sp. NBC_00038]|uniref:hypothetical protein n=1 Tax=Streptomyces sp. NBC_00038 TaxID=2903615 RepID=UPI0022507589|nr:hypothetical protein [Streptomyces sp. NBC_00038]MCX5558455.1 hypothetical protein [Streptomyces sp. NBC_00038]